MRTPSHRGGSSFRVRGMGGRHNKKKDIIIPTSLVLKLIIIFILTYYSGLAILYDN